jgi:hypothetical protein
LTARLDGAGHGNFAAAMNGSLSPALNQAFVSIRGREDTLDRLVFTA